MIRVWMWLMWLKLADLFFTIKKTKDSPENYFPIYTTKSGMCSKCSLNNIRCNGLIMIQLNEKYGDCVFSEKQHYYVKIK